MECIICFSTGEGKLVGFLAVQSIPLLIIDFKNINVPIQAIFAIFWDELLHVCLYKFIVI